MRFALAALSAAEILVAKKPEMGLDTRVFPSVVPVQKVGKIVVSGGTNTWIPEAGVDWTAAGLDLCLKVDSPLRCTAAPVVTLECTLVGPLTEEDVATTFNIPSWVPDQSYSYQVGRGFDLVPTGVGNSAKRVLAVTGITSITGITGYAEFIVYGSQASSDFKELGWSKSVSGPYSTPASIAFPDGYNPAAAIRAGRPEIPELTVSMTHIASSAGMTRYNGHEIAMLAKVIKDKSVHVGNILYVGYRPQASPERGEGNDEVVETSTGPYTDCIQFDAL